VTPRDYIMLIVPIAIVIYNIIITTKDRSEYNSEESKRDRIVNEQQTRDFRNFISNLQLLVNEHGIEIKLITASLDSITKKLERGEDRIGRTEQHLAVLNRFMDREEAQDG